MPLQSPPQAAQHVAAPRNHGSPSERETRAQAVHRLQVGLFGVCAMLLLVALANIIKDRASLAEAQSAAAAVSTTDAARPRKPATDPLADIGVVPAAEPGTAPPPAEPAR